MRNFSWQPTPAKKRRNVVRCGTRSVRAIWESPRERDARVDLANHDAICKLCQHPERYGSARCSGRDDLLVAWKRIVEGEKAASIRDAGWDYRTHYRRSKRGWSEVT